MRAEDSIASHHIASQMLASSKNHSRRSTQLTAAKAPTPVTQPLAVCVKGEESRIPGEGEHPIYIDTYKPIYMYTFTVKQHCMYIQCFDVTTKEASNEPCIEHQANFVFVQVIIFNSQALKLLLLRQTIYSPDSRQR